MATILDLNFDAGSQGTAATVGNTTNGAYAFDAMETGLTFDSATAQHGSYALLSSPTASSYARKDFSSTTASMREGFRCISAVPASDVYLVRFGVGTTRYASLHVNTTGRLRVSDFTGTGGVWTATNPLSPDTDYWFEFQVDSGTSTSDGKITFSYYLKGSTTPIETIALTTLDCGSGVTLTRVYALKYAGNTQFAFDDLKLTDAFEAIGPAGATNAAPTVGLSSDKSEIHPGETATLTATATDSDGTISTTGWSTTAGTLTGSGMTRTLTAPASLNDQTATITFTATDNLGAQSQTTTDVTLKASMSKTFNGTSWIPHVESLITS